MHTSTKSGGFENIETKLRAKGFSPTTIRDTLATVQNVFRWAVVCERICYDPSVGLKVYHILLREKDVLRTENQKN